LVTCTIAALAEFFTVWRLGDTPWTIGFTAALYAFGISAVILFLILSFALWMNSGVKRKLIAALTLIPVLIMILLAWVFIADHPAGYTHLVNALLRIIPESQRSGIEPMPVSISKTQWQEDIRFLRKMLPQRHAYLFLHLGQAEYEEAFDILEDEANTLSEKEIGWEICRIMALISDGHTQVVSIPFSIPPYLDSRIFPLRIFRFDDGWRVTEADADHGRLKGTKITMIDGVPVDEVFERIVPFIPGENEYYKMQWAFPYFLNASLLKYLKIIQTESESVFTFRDAAGAEFSETLRPVLAPLYMRWFHKSRELDDISRRKMLRRNYWYEAKPGQMLYLQVNQLSNQPGGQGIKQFCKELDSLLTHSPIEKLLIDLRNCNGGDNTRIECLTRLAQHPRINRKGRLFVLIGRQTFSAGVSLAAAIERNTHAIFAGEPSGSGPNQCGDAQLLILPNSRIMLQVSSRYHQQSYAEDRRLAIEPRIKIQYSFDDWLRGTDPALDMIGNYNVDPEVTSISDLKKQSVVTIGRFKFDEDKTAEVKLQNGNLWLHVSDHAPFLSTRLHPANEYFNTDIASMTIRFTSNGLVIARDGFIDTLRQMTPVEKSPAELLQEGNIPKTIAAYRDARARGFHFSFRTESFLNEKGYELLAKGRRMEANDLFRLNAELFPASGTWDSMAESCLSVGKTEEARRCCMRALELNPENQRMRMMLQELK
jgi:tetratricopeptide (TPR) repeat protein